MRIGCFWGMTAPMFVAAFPEREEPLKLFDAMRETSNGRYLLGLQKELSKMLQLKKCLVYKPSVSVAAEMGDVYWKNGSLDDSDMVKPFVREVTETVLASILNAEAKGKFVDTSSLPKCVERELATKSFPVSRTSRAVREIVKALPVADKANASQWLNQYHLQMELAESVVVDGKRKTLSAEEKKVIRYYLGRMDDIEFWIKALHLNRAEEESFFGYPFSMLVNRKPESVRYAVLESFERVKHSSNAKVLDDVLKSIEEDSKKFRKVYHQKVGVIGSDTNVSVSAEGPAFFRENEILRGSCFSYRELSERDASILNAVLTGVERTVPEKLNELFGLSISDWNVYGVSLCDIGIYGLNGSAENLFAEAICNTVLAVHKHYKPEDVIQKMDEILTYDVDALVDTFIPVGEVITDE